MHAVISKEARGTEGRRQSPVSPGALREGTAQPCPHRAAGQQALGLLSRKTEREGERGERERGRSRASSPGPQRVPAAAGPR